MQIIAINGKRVDTRSRNDVRLEEINAEILRLMSTHDVLSSYYRSLMRERVHRTNPNGNMSVQLFSAYDDKERKAIKAYFQVIFDDMEVVG